MASVSCFAGRGLALVVMVAAGAGDGRSGTAAETWADCRVAGPFVCRADSSLDGAERLLAELGQLQEDLVRMLAIPPADQWIELYLFHDQRVYRAYLKNHFAELPYRRALYVKCAGPGMVLAYRSKELDVDLRHECTHALLHAALPMVPLWLDEGLAEYFEVSPAERAEDNPYLANVRWKAKLGMSPRLDKLEKKAAIEDMGGTEYRDAWAWVHFMLHGPAEAGDELRQFLDDLGAHSPPGLLSERLERRLPGVEQRFVDHFRSGTR